MAKASKPLSPKQIIERKGEAIAACRDASGRVTPRSVWQSARDPNSILHNDFDWDVQRAAEKEWDRTAAELIRKVRFVIKVDNRRIAVPFYLSDPRDAQSSYIATTRVARNAALSERVLRDELARIISAIKRGMTLAAAFDLASSFERMLDEATEIEKRLNDADVGDEARA